MWGCCVGGGAEGVALVVNGATEATVVLTGVATAATVAVRRGAKRF